MEVICATQEPMPGHDVSSRDCFAPDVNRLRSFSLNSQIFAFVENTPSICWVVVCVVVNKGLVIGLGGVGDG